MPLDHVDLRVLDLEAVRPFYEALLPALGYPDDMAIPGWLQYQGPTGFFGVTASPGHVPNENRVAFAAGSRAEVDRLAALVRALGALDVEGPDFEGDESYYAVFFADPAGNRLEVCHRADR